MVSDTDSGTIIYATNNTQAIAHPFWSILREYLDNFSVEPSNCDNNDTSAACNTEPVCNLALSFDTLNDLVAASRTFPDLCTDYYTLDVLGTMLNSTLVNYTAANTGYDSVFGQYVTYTKEMVPQTLTNFTAPSSPDLPGGRPGNKYFKCEFIETAGGGSETINYNPCPVSNVPKSFEHVHTFLGCGDKYSRHPYHPK